MIDEVESAEGGSDGVSSEGEKTPMADRIQVNFFFRNYAPDLFNEFCLVFFFA